MHEPISRRSFIKGAAAGGMGLVVAGCDQRLYKPTSTTGRALIAAADRYSPDLVETLISAISEFPDVVLRRKRVLLKPNLVETTNADRPINTHPALIAAAVEACRKLGAANVLVGDGPGHRRDAELVLEQSGLGDALHEVAAEYVDLNHDRVAPVLNRGGRTTLRRLFLPASVLEADVVISLAKLKTHHWAGATLGMKNLFGLMPGIVYGWPKNVLHRAGSPAAFSIHQCIADIAETVRPALTIIDGIVGMEGDGPIMGSPRPVGCLIVSDKIASADATAAAIMGLQPHRIRYLRYADAAGLGGTSMDCVEQRGERLDRFACDFALLRKFAYLKQP